MKKLLIALTALVALAIPASSKAATWVTNPTCTATTTTLTCTGRAAGLHPKEMFGLGPLEAGIQGEVHYFCADPAFEWIWFGGPYPAPPDFEYLAAGTAVRNGQTFSIQYPPNPSPDAMLAQVLCTSGVWTRDTNYYNVRVVVGWGFGSATPVTALEAPIGTVSP
jgi:hypothetical protein